MAVSGQFGIFIQFLGVLMLREAAKIFQGGGGNIVSFSLGETLSQVQNTNTWWKISAGSN